jgi:hypothetical protein
LGLLIISVVYRHRFDATPDLDPTFHFNADPDQEWHQNNANPHANLTPSLYIFFLLLFTAMSVYNVFLFSNVS